MQINKGDFSPTLPNQIAKALEEAASRVEPFPSISFGTLVESIRNNKTFGSGDLAIIATSAMSMASSICKCMLQTDDANKEALAIFVRVGALYNSFMPDKYSMLSYVAAAAINDNTILDSRLLMNTRETLSLTEKAADLPAECWSAQAAIDLATCQVYCKRVLSLLSDGPLPEQDKMEHHGFIANR